ncbi:hypothetical protein KKI19_03895 [Patescibacteria group bacterium]|nr:hypothetical protein [Patescibacteria group bacterium]
MSRVERISISSKNFIEGSDTAGKRMAAHIARREPGRVVMKNEIEGLMEGIIVIPERKATRVKEGTSNSKKTEIVSSYPLGWILIKRY